MAGALGYDGTEKKKKKKSRKEKKSKIFPKNLLA